MKSNTIDSDASQHVVRHPLASSFLLATLIVKKEGCSSLVPRFLRMAAGLLMPSSQTGIRLVFYRAIISESINGTTTTQNKIWEDAIALAPPDMLDTFMPYVNVLRYPPPNVDTEAKRNELSRQQSVARRELFRLIQQVDPW
jgi:hypothetical protein